MGSSLDMKSEESRKNLVTLWIKYQELMQSKIQHLRGLLHTFRCLHHDFLLLTTALKTRNRTQMLRSLWSGERATNSSAVLASE